GDLGEVLGEGAAVREGARLRPGADALLGTPARGPGRTVDGRVRGQVDCRPTGSRGEGLPLHDRVAPRARDVGEAPGVRRVAIVVTGRGRVGRVRPEARVVGAEDQFE